MSRYKENQRQHQRLGLHPSSAISMYANQIPYSSQIQITDDSGKPFTQDKNNSLSTVGQTLHTLLREYNNMLITIGYGIKRSELRKQDLIDLRQVFTFNGKPYAEKTNKHMLPDITSANHQLDSTLIGSWYHLIPCFNAGVFQLNDARYIQYTIKNIDTVNNTLDIHITDYARIDDIWQLGVQTTVHYNCHALTQKTNPLIQTKRAICDMLGIDITNENTTIDDILPNSIINWFISQYVSYSDTKTYADIYQLIPLSTFNWSEQKRKNWNNLILKYAQTNIEKLEKANTSPAKELAKIFTYAVLLSNKLLQEHKPKPIRTRNHTKRTIITDTTTTQPRKLVRTIGPITMTSEKPPKLPTQETVVKYKTAVWKSRGGVRRLKNGKLVPFKESIKHRKCLKDVTTATPQSVIQFQNNQQKGAETNHGNT